MVIVPTVGNWFWLYIFFCMGKKSVSHDWNPRYAVLGSFLGPVDESNLWPLWIYSVRAERIVTRFFRAGGDLRLHDNENMRPIDYTRRLEANSKFKKEMLQFLEQQQESFSNFQRTRQKIELGTPHRVKLTKPAKTSGMFGKNYGTSNFGYFSILHRF